MAGCGGRDRAHARPSRTPSSTPRSRRAGGTPDPGGTPGEAPELRAPEREKGIPIVRQGEVWRFFRGRVEPPAAWREPGFDDSGWESGPSGFGFSDGDDATEIDDMAGSYLTLYTRRSFTVEDPSKLERLILLADYDDGFIASLNGREVARANVPPGEASHDTPAPTTHESGTPSEIPIGRAVDLLVPGRNVLAVVAHNASLSSSDLTLIVELESRAPRERGARRKAPGLVINEVLAGEEGYVEIFNPAPSAASLDGWTLTDDPGDLEKRALPAGLEVGPRGFLALGRTELGETIRLRGPELFLALRGPDGRIADALRLDGLGPEGPEAPLPRGRLPDGSSEIETLDPPTPGARNRIEIAGAPVID